MSRSHGERQSRIRLNRRRFLAPSPGVAVHAQQPRGQRLGVPRAVGGDPLKPGRLPAPLAVLRPAVTGPAEPEALPAPPASNLVALHIAAPRRLPIPGPSAPGATGSRIERARTLRQARSTEGAELLPPVPHLRADGSSPGRETGRTFLAPGARALVISVAAGPYEVGGIRREMPRRQTPRGTRRAFRMRRCPVGRSGRFSRGCR